MRHAMPIVAMIWALALVNSPAMSEPGDVAKPSSKLASALGRDVTTLRDGDSGRIVDLLVDEHGHVRAAVVEFGGFLGIGTRKIAVEWAAFRFAEPTITVAVSRDQLRTAPEFKPNGPPVVLKPMQK